MPSRDLAIEENVALAPFSTLGIGGPARFYVAVDTHDDVRRAIRWAHQRDLPWMALGGGSNVLIADEGFGGLVVHVALHGIEQQERGGEALLTAAAGEEWDPLVEQCVRQGWAGVECLSGIPGRVGATPMQNVGAYGQEVKDSVVEVRTYDATQDAWRTFKREACRFQYRNSRFKGEEPGRYVILSVVYRLRPGGEPTVKYPDLQKAMENRPPSLQEVRRAVLEVRRRKSMVLDTNDPNSRSVGSFFMNPIMAEDELAAVLGRAQPESPPHYPAGPGKVKLSAAWLIERAGFARGYSCGAVGLSQNHALAIINRGGASARDVLELVRRIQQGVRDRFGVELQPEPVLVQ